MTTLLLDHLEAGAGIGITGPTSNKLQISFSGGAAYAPTAHTHTASQVTDFTSAAATVAFATLATQFSNNLHVLIGNGVHTFTSRQLVTTDISGFTAAVDARVAAVGATQYLKTDGSNDMRSPLDTTLDLGLYTTMSGGSAAWDVGILMGVRTGGPGIPQFRLSTEWHGVIGSDGHIFSISRYDVSRLFSIWPSNNTVDPQARVVIGETLLPVNTDPSLVLIGSSPLLGLEDTGIAQTTLGRAWAFENDAGTLNLWRTRRSSSGAHAYYLVGEPAITISNSLGHFRLSELRLTDPSATGSPFLAFSQAATRRAHIQYHHGNTALHIASEYGSINLYAGDAGSPTLGVEVMVDRVRIPKLLHVRRASHTQMVLDTVDATFSPSLEFWQNGTARSYIQYQDNGDLFYFANNYGEVILRPGVSGTSAISLIARIPTNTDPARVTVQGTNAAIQAARSGVGGVVMQNLVEVNTSYARAWIGHNAVWHEATSRWKVRNIGANDAAGIFIPNGGGFWFIIHQNIASADRDITHSTFTTGDVNQSSATGITNPVMTISTAGNLNIKGILGETIMTPVASSGWSIALHAMRIKKIGRTVFISGGTFIGSAGATIGVSYVKVAQLPIGTRPPADFGWGVEKVGGPTGWGLSILATGEFRIHFAGGGTQPREGVYRFIGFHYDVEV